MQYLQKSQNDTITSALTKDRWIYVKVNVEGKYEEVLTKSILPLVKDLKKNNHISKFIYKKDGLDPDFMMFFFKTSLYNSERYIKKQLKGSLEELLDLPLTSVHPIHEFSDFYKITTEKSHSIEYLDYFIFDYMQNDHNVKLSEHIMPTCSDIMINIMEEEGEWGYEEALEKGLVLHLAMVHAFDLSTQELANYFDHKFLELFKLLELEKTDPNNKDEWQSRFLKSLQDNFENQQENLIAYCNYILSMLEDGDEFEDEWVNEWTASCKNAHQAFLELKKNNKLSTTIKPLKTLNKNITKEQQNDWAHFACYSDFIDNQLLFGPDFSLILLFTLSKSLNTLAENE